MLLLVLLFARLFLVIDLLLCVGHLIGVALLLVDGLFSLLDDDLVAVSLVGVLLDNHLVGVCRLA